MKNRRRIAALLLVAAALFTACGGSAPATNAPNASVASASDEFPPASESSGTNPAFDYGTTVTITGSALLPAWLVAPIGADVTWVNQSSTPTSVHFDNYSDASGPVDSGPISPGQSWAWHATGNVSIVYHVPASPPLSGNLQILPDQDI